MCGRNGAGGEAYGMMCCGLITPLNVAEDPLTGLVIVTV